MSKVKGEKNSLYLPTVLAKNKYTYKIKKDSCGETIRDIFWYKCTNGPLAQWLEQHTHNVKVISSSLVRPT